MKAETMNHIAAAFDEPVAIFDLDNCVSNDEWRIPRIRFELPNECDEKWEAYHLLCGGDNPGNLEVLNRALKDGLVPAFVTMRPLRMWNATVDWIEKRLALPRGAYHLYMRPDGDHTPSVQLKHTIALRLMEHHQIKEAYDDRADIVDMYRSIGILNARVMRIHNVSAHNPPPATAESDSDPAIRHATIAQPEPMPLAPPSRGEEPPGAPGAKLPPGTFPFTTDPHQAFKHTTGAVATPQTAADILERMAATQRAKAAEYRDNYRMVPKVMAALFPEGVPPELVLTEKWHIFELVVVKMTRLAATRLTHLDSAHDVGIYGAMMELCMTEERNRK